MKLDSLGTDTIVQAPAPEVGHPSTTDEAMVTLPTKPTDSVATPSTVEIP